MKQQHADQTIEVWFQDEARIGQQGTLTHVWAERDTRPTAVKQTEYEWVHLFAAVNPITGNSSAMLAPHMNTLYMNAHLKFISEAAGTATQVVLALDGAGWHTAQALKVPSHITLLPLPPYSPELNPIERVWAYLRSHYLSNRIYKDYDEIFTQAAAAWNRLDEPTLKSITDTQWIRRAN